MVGASGAKLVVQAFVWPRSRKSRDAGAPSVILVSAISQTNYTTADDLGHPPIYGTGCLLGSLAGHRERTNGGGDVEQHVKHHDTCQMDCYDNVFGHLDKLDDCYLSILGCVT
jgi:hypothetical protein